MLFTATVMDLTYPKAEKAFMTGVRVAAYFRPNFPGTVKAQFTAPGHTLG
jgi:hypothetical protein